MTSPLAYINDASFDPRARSGSAISASAVNTYRGCVLRSATGPWAGSFSLFMLRTNAGLDENRIQLSFSEEECSDRLVFQGQDADELEPTFFLLPGGKVRSALRI